MFALAAAVGLTAPFSMGLWPLVPHEAERSLRLDQGMAAHEPVETLGRETELEIVDQFLREVAAGPAALVLHGEAGIGKTTLWKHAVALASQLPMAVLSCRPTQAESDLPYMGLGDLLAFVPDQILGMLPDPQRRSLEIALLRADAGGALLLQRTVSVAVLNVLRETSRTAPVLVAIDDAHWLDVPSRRVLRFALRRVGDGPIGFLAVTRAGEDDEDVLGLDGIANAEHVRHLTIGPLAPNAVERLVRSRLHGPMASHVVRRLTEASGGNPLFAEELVRTLKDSHDVAELGPPLTIPASLTEALGSRLAGLPKTTRDCLLVAAALSRPTVDLIQLAYRKPAQVIGALAAGVDAGVIEVRGGSVTFVHPLLAGVVYAQASADGRRTLHAQLAVLVHEPEERARHLGLSAVAPDEAVAAAIAEGGRSAASRGAPDVAETLFEQAARLTPADAAAAAAVRLVDAADQCIALREMPRAKRLLDEAIANLRTGPVRARALHRLGRVGALQDGFEAAIPTLMEALHHVGDDVALRVAIERDLTFARVQVGDPSGALPHARAAYQSAMDSGSEGLIAEALDQLCLAEFAAGNSVPGHLLERAIALDAQVGPIPRAQHPGWGSGRVQLAMVLKWSNRFDLARFLLRSLLTAFTERGDEGSLDTVLFHLGELELWAGNWQIVTDFCAAAEDLEARTGQAVVERRTQLLSAMLDEVRGHVDTARSRGEKWLELCEQAADPPGLIRCLKVLGRLELSLHHPARALDYLLRGLAIESRAGYDHGLCRILPEAVDALIEAGRLTEAEIQLQRLETYATKSDRPWAAAAAARCRAMFDAANGDLARAQTGLLQACDLHDRLGEPFERGRSLLALGIVQRRLKRKRDARETLERGLAIFDALGAQTWSQLTRAELGRIGGRAASPHELTSTEARVAQLVAEGLTNREVAASVFLSEKTIETNLTRIYEKLGVESRRQLARKLRTGLPQA